MSVAVPTHLPVRADGQRLRHLSVSSLDLFYRCPELWRRKYLARQPLPTSGAMHLGRMCDEVISAWFGSRLTDAPQGLADTLDLYATRWDASSRDVRFDPPLPEAVLRERGVQVVARYILGPGQAITPVAVQREIRLRLHPSLSWDLLGYLDVETATGLVVDVKVKARHVTATTVERSLQPNAYLLARRHEQNPATGFEYHSIRHTKNGIDIRVIPAPRTGRNLDAFAARLALAARHISDMADRYGPCGVWPLATPEHWACSHRYCSAYSSCPGGAGFG